MACWRLIEFECPRGHRFEELIKVHNREHPPTHPCACGELGERVFSVPTLHTISTHLRDTDVPHSGDGYFDHSLRDVKTGKVPYISSLAQKRKILKERGFEEFGRSHRRDDAMKARGRTIFS